MFLIQKISFDNSFFKPIGYVLTGLLVLIAGILAIVTIPVWLPLLGLYKLGKSFMTEPKPEEEKPKPTPALVDHLKNCHRTPNYGRCAYNDIENCPKREDMAW